MLKIITDDNLRCFLNYTILCNCNFNSTANHNRYHSFLTLRTSWMNTSLLRNWSLRHNLSTLNFQAFFFLFFFFKRASPISSSLFYFISRFFDSSSRGNSLSKLFSVMNRGASSMAVIYISRRKPPAQLRFRLVSPVSASTSSSISLSFTAAIIILRSALYS